MSRARSIKSNKLTGVKLSGIKKCFAFKPLSGRSIIRSATTHPEFNLQTNLASALIYVAQW